MSPELEKNLEYISEAIALEQKTFAPAEIIPYLKKIINRFVIIQDSRYCSKKDAIQIVDMDVERSLDATPFYLSAQTWDQLYDEASLWLSESRKGVLVSPITMTEGVADFYEHGYDAGKEMDGWSNFSKHYRIAKRELTIITGIPGHGKSEFLDALLVKLADQYGFKFAIFSPENFPHEVHIEKLLSKYNGLPFHKGPNVRMTPEHIAMGLTWIDQHFVFLHPHEDELHLDSVLGLAQKAIDEKKIDGLVIDPWNEIEHNLPRDMQETRYIGQSLTKCRRFARAQNICFWISAHPAKLYKDRDKKSGEEKADYRVPSPYDIAGSAHWFNKSDNCLCVYRHRDNSVTVHVQKIKFKMRGEPGAIDFTYDRISGRYTEKNPDERNGFTDF